MIIQYASLLVSDILDNPFANVTLLDIANQFSLLDGPLPGDHEQCPCSDGENYCTSQARVD